MGLDFSESSWRASKGRGLRLKRLDGDEKRGEKIYARRFVAIVALVLVPLVSAVAQEKSAVKKETFKQPTPGTSSAQKTLPEKTARGADDVDDDVYSVAAAPGKWSANVHPQVVVLYGPVGDPAFEEMRDKVRDMMLNTQYLGGVNVGLLTFDTNFYKKAPPKLFTTERLKEKKEAVPYNPPAMQLYILGMEVFTYPQITDDTIIELRGTMTIMQEDLVIPELKRRAEENSGPVRH